MVVVLASLLAYGYHVMPNFFSCHTETIFHRFLFNVKAIGNLAYLFPLFHAHAIYFAVLLV